MGQCRNKRRAVHNEVNRVPRPMTSSPRIPRYNTNWPASRCHCNTQIKHGDAIKRDLHGRRTDAAEDDILFLFFRLRGVGRQTRQQTRR